jgi:hypothetical protein
LRGMTFKITVANPKAHHEQGRVERRIKVLQDMLQRLSDTDDVCRTLLEWETMFARIASQVDDLPIARGSAIAATDLGWEIITPNRLKLGRNAHRNLEGPVVLDNSPKNQLERSKLIFARWYKIFLDRLPLLIPTVEKGTGREVMVGDLVLFVFQDSNIPGMETWKIARVVSLDSPRTVTLEYTNAGGGKEDLAAVHPPSEPHLGSRRVRCCSQGPSKLAVRTLRTSYQTYTTHAGVESVSEQ